MPPPGPHGKRPGHERLEGLGRDGALDAEPADQADADGQAHERGADLAESRPAREERRVQALALTDDADHAHDDLEDDRAEQEGEDGLAEGHAVAEGGAEKELGQRGHLPEALDGDAEPGPAGGGWHAGQGEVVGVRRTR
jgi:hypothetical protein